MKRYKPLVDKLYFIIAIPTLTLMAVLTAVAAGSLTALLITAAADLLVICFLISPLFGYIELRERTLFIKFGFILKREIPYEKIRGAVKERKWYSDSMMSLKSAMEHVNIKYNGFDLTCVSVVDNDAFIAELCERVSAR